jgi:hypothetical protein
MGGKEECWQEPGERKRSESLADGRKGTQVQRDPGKTQWVEMHGKPAASQPRVDHRVAGSLSRYRRPKESRDAQNKAILRQKQKQQGCREEGLWGSQSWGAPLWLHVQKPSLTGKVLQVLGGHANSQASQKPEAAKRDLALGGEGPGDWGQRGHHES